ncbi:MAG: DUF1501 domain-containing protein [Betaproteobacteria bacterium]
MTRRNVLLSLCTGALLFNTGRTLASPAARPRLLVIFLRGGYDSASVLVPVASPFYYEARPDIAIAKPSPAPESAVAIDDQWGLHPALRNTVYPLFLRGEAAFIPFAGTNDTSRSHFETQEAIELGLADDRVRNARSGFLNRLAATLTGTEPMAFTDNLPIILQGPVQVANASLRNPAKPSVDGRQSHLIESMYRGTGLEDKVVEGFALREQIAREMAAEMQAASGSAITAKGFELEARRMARLMGESHDIGFVDVGGWDTHVNQGAGTGYLASRLEELGRGLAAYAHEMDSAWRSTLVVVLSEFGRTFRQNGNRGTDHGHGTTFWVLGGSLRGGRVAGDQVRVSASTLFQNRDLPVLNEYRQLLAGLFARQFGLDRDRLAQVFPGVSPLDLNLL